ncbi:hypothetical protein LTS08_007804 [Lithohypha guttulata]|nr:hypothetical protein LTS08_007804 [Lithohypha guttulata]
MSYREAVATLIDQAYFYVYILFPPCAVLTFVAAVPQATQLILDLQYLARDSGHPVPLLIAIDQENGGVNTLYDGAYMRQFPSAMAVATTGDKQLARRIARATAEELTSCGINWVLGPVLDVLTNARNQPLGVRSYGDDPAIVSAFGYEAIKGLQEGGVATCGKHFPSYGNLEFFGAPTDVPTITDSLENLSQNALVPFRHAIAGGIDAIMVGGVAMSSDHINVMHACLSEQICRDLLRMEMKFGGIVVSECLEMEALSRNIGISGGTVMAFKAGCDIILTCRSMSVQEEAINGLTAGLENGMIEKGRVQESVKRVLSLKDKYTSWEKAFSPPGVDNLDCLRYTNSNLSSMAYSNTVRVVRDQKKYLPLSDVMRPEDELLLLTPLVKPLPGSAASKQSTEEILEEPVSVRTTHVTDGTLMAGEKVFQKLGQALAIYRNGKVLHASYTANGIRPQHEALLERASAVVVITADAGRNKYQAAFAKHIAMLCRTHENLPGRPSEKPCVVAAVSSPFDFASDMSIGTYICTFDFTDTALQTLVKVLHDESTSADTKTRNSTNHKTRKHSQARQQWLVEHYRDDRDRAALDALLLTSAAAAPPGSSLLRVATAASFLLSSDVIDEAHFVVRNSSTKELIGFCATYYSHHDSVGSIGAIVVHPSRRHQSVGHSLHHRAIRALLQKPGLHLLELGTRLPNLFPGLPSDDPEEHRKLSQWFSKLGWTTYQTKTVLRLSIPDLSHWEAPDGLGKSLAMREIKYDLVHGTEYTDSIMEHVKLNAGTDLQVLYKIALSNKEGCAVVRGKNASDGSIIATVLLYRQQSKLALFVPCMRNADSLAGGLGSTVVSTNVEDKASLLQGLMLLGVRQLKKQGISSLLLDYVDDPSALPGLQRMGFTVLNTFETIQSLAEDWDTFEKT